MGFKSPLFGGNRTLCKPARLYAAGTIKKPSLSCQILLLAALCCTGGMAARIKVGMCRVHSARVSFGRCVHKRNLKRPSPEKPPQRGILSPSWTPYRFIVRRAGSCFSHFRIHMCRKDCAACFCLADIVRGALVNVTPSNTKPMLRSHQSGVWVCVDARELSLSVYMCV